MNRRNKIKKLWNRGKFTYSATTWGITSIGSVVGVINFVHSNVYVHRHYRQSVVGQIKLLDFEDKESCYGKNTNFEETIYYF